MDIVAHQFFQGLLDSACNADLTRGGNREKRLEKQDFLIFAQIASAPYAMLMASMTFGPNLLYHDTTLCTVDTETSVWMAISEAGRGSTNAFQMISHLRCSLPAVCLSRSDTSNSERCEAADVTTPMKHLPKNYVRELIANSRLNRELV